MPIPASPQTHEAMELDEEFDDFIGKNVTVRNLKQIKSKEDLDLDNDFEDFMRDRKSVV